MSRKSSSPLIGLVSFVLTTLIIIAFCRWVEFLVQVALAMYRTKKDKIAAKKAKQDEKKWVLLT